MTRPIGPCFYPLNKATKRERERERASCVFTEFFSLWAVFTNKFVMRLGSEVSRVLETRVPRVGKSEIHVEFKFLRLKFLKRKSTL